MQIAPLIYPVNYLRHNVINTLSLMFSSVNVLSPTDDEELSPVKAPGFSTPLYIHRIAPSPPEKKKRFRKILREMKVWGEQMGLDNKSVAESIHTEAFQPAAESVSSIFSSIKQKKTGQAMLQTRLFLQIALENDMQDDLLELEIKKLEEKKKKLTEIMGDELPEEETGISLPHEETRPDLYGIKMLNMPERRLKAWMRLANHYDDTPLDTWPLGESIAIKDILDRAYEKATGKIAKEILNLQLPREIEDPALKSKLSDGVMKLMDELRDELSQRDGSDIEENALIKNICHRIEVSVDAKEAQKHPGPRVNLTIYPGMHMDDLLPLAAGLKRRKNPPKLFSKWCYGSFYLM